MRNNIFYANNQGILAQNYTPFTHDHNLYYFTGSQPNLNYGWGPGERVADPMLVNVAGGSDLHLRQGSPAIDAGVATLYPTDMDGATVPAGSAVDIGAYEYGSVLSGAPTPSGTPTQTATPTSTSAPTSTPTRSSTPTATPVPKKTRRPTSAPANITAPAAAPMPDGTPTPSVTSTDTATPTASAGGQATPAPTLTPSVTRPPYAHVKAGPRKPPWRAADDRWQVTVTVKVFAAARAPLVNVLVNAAWSGALSGTGSCTTDGSGECDLTSEPISIQGNETFTVVSLTYPGADGAAGNREELSAGPGDNSLTVSPP